MRCTMKALFFLRHYNDIDHITPVIYKWTERGHVCDVVLIGKNQFDGDFRIEYLRKLDGVQIAHIRDLLPWHEFVLWRLQMLLLVRSARHSFVGPFVKLLARVYNKKKREIVWRHTAKLLLERSFRGTDHGVMVFDWMERNSEIAVEWVEIMVADAHARGLGTVSLPHGDSPHASQLIRRGEWRLEPDFSFSAAGIFDKVVVPNELCSIRFRPLFDNNKIAVLGSPRYCDEWLTKLKEILPVSPMRDSGSRLKVVMFLRKASYTAFWEEIEQVIRMIAAFPGTELVIKLHTRGGWKQSLSRKAELRRLPNVRMVADEMHSTHLMNWANIIIDLATSVVFEAVKAKKPVLAAEYLYAGRSAIAKYMPETELMCRDDVYNKIKQFLSNASSSFYNEKHRQHFLKEMVEAKGPGVLLRYVALLEQQAQRKA
jgi:hypothetical protein